jgi:hypothetical protein
MPMPPEPEHSTSVDAGAIRIVVEQRVLTEKMLRDAYKDDPVAQANFDRPDREKLPDLSGVSLHVFSARDDLEYLRFDCFAEDSHYHYIQHAENVNLVLNFDDTADGEMLPWALERIRTRLPEMLRRAGATALAEEIDPQAVAAALARVQEIVGTPAVAAGAGRP